MMDIPIYGWFNNVLCVCVLTMHTGKQSCHFKKDYCESLVFILVFTFAFYDGN